jgi:predicted transcriptional regulator YdeE
MTQILEYINNHPKEIKIVIGITNEQFEKLVRNAQKLEFLIGIYFSVSEYSANNIFHDWIDILQELLPSSLLEQFQEKEDEYLWIQEILTRQELIVYIVV